MGEMTNMSYCTVYPSPWDWDISPDFAIKPKLWEAVCFDFHVEWLHIL